MKSSKIKKYQIIFLLFLSSIFGFNNQGLKIIKNDLVLGYVQTIENNRLISLNSFSTVLGYKNFVNDKTEKIVVNIGAAKDILTTVAKGNFLKAIKIAIIAINPAIHLKKCNPGLFVL